MAESVDIVGVVGVDVVPVVDDFSGRVRRQVDPEAARLGEDIGRRVGAPISRRISESIGDGVRSGGRSTTGPAARAGEDYATAFGRTMQARLQAALRNIPPVQLTAESTDVERKAAAVQARIAEIQGKTVGVDITDEEALLHVQQVRNLLSALSRDVEKLKAQGRDVPINVNALRSLAEVTVLQRELRSLQREAARPVRVPVEPEGAFARQFTTRVRAALSSLPPVRLSADSSDSDRELAHIRQELEALSGQRVGVTISDAEARAQIRRLQTELANLSGSSASVDVSVNAASAAAQLQAFEAFVRRLDGRNARVDVDVDATRSVASVSSLLVAGAAIGPAIVPSALAAAAAVASMGPIAAAVGASIGVLGLGFAGIGGAVKGLSQAQSGAGQTAAAYASSQVQIANAVDGVRSAERSLAQAQAAAKRAQDALTEAREEARRSLQDLNAEVKRGVLDQRQASLDLQKAKSALDKTNADPRTSELQRAQAQLTYDQAVQQIDDLKVRQERLASDQQAAQKAGVDGSKQVVQAQRAIADAQDRVLSAQQSLVSAQRSLQQATTQAGNAGAAAMQRLADSMEGLSPAGVAFAQFIFGLKPVLNEVRAAAQQGLLPGVQQAITSLLPYVPALTRFIGELAARVGQLFVEGTRAFTAPFWRQFFGFLGGEATGNISVFAQILFNLATGAAALFQAFGSLFPAVGSGLLGLSQRFAEFGLAAQNNRGFQDLLGFIRDVGPVVISTILEVVRAGIRLVAALAPLGVAPLIALRLIASAINALPIPVLTALAGVVIALLIGWKLWNITLPISALVTTGFATSVKSLTAAMLANPVGLVVIAIVALIAAVVLAYQHFEGFRKVVNAAWEGIKSAALVVWNTVLRPLFNFLASVLRDQVIPAVLFLWHNAVEPAFAAIGVAIGIFWNQYAKPYFMAWWTVIQTVLIPIVMFLWRNVIRPAFDGISKVISFVWGQVLEPIFNGIVFVIKNFLVPIFLFLWRNVIQPVFQGVQIVISVAWAIIQVIFGLIVIFIREVLAPIFLWLWKTIIKPVFDGIASVISFVWTKLIKPVFEALGGFIERNVAPAFKRGVDAISKAWSAVREAAKVPIKFVIERVINQGIIDNYNALAGHFGVGKVSRVPLPAGFAAGGILPGYTPGRDVHRFYSPTAGLLDLSGGESIIRPEGTKALGAGWVHGINAAARTGGVTGARRFIGGYASGGILPNLGGYAGGGILDAILHPIDWIKGKTAGALDLLRQFSGTTFGRMATALPKKIFDAVTGGIKKLFGFGTGGNVNLGRSSNQSVDAILRIARVFLPSARVSSGYRPGSQSLSGARDYHSQGLAADLVGGGNAGMLAMAKGFYGISGRLLEEIHSQSPGFFVKNGRRVGAGYYGNEVAGHFDHVHIAARADALTTFDSGGYLPPGISTVFNGTGRPEPVLTDSQWRQMLAGRAAGGDGASYTTNVYPQRADFTITDLQALQDRQEALHRVGRPA